MKELIKKIHNDNFQWYDFWGFILLIAFIAFFFAPIMGGFLTAGPIFLLMQLGVPIDLNDPFLTITVMYLTPIGVWIFMILFMHFFKPDQPILDRIGPKAMGNTGRMLLIGIALGFVSNGICALAALLNKDIALYFASFQPLKNLVVFLAIFVQASAEELVCRGYIYNKLRRGYRHPAVAIIGNAVIFGSIHLNNRGVTPLAIAVIVFFGIWCSLIVYYYDSLWCAMALHAAWNYTQNVLFGLPNSGLVFDFSIFKLDAASARNSFAYDVTFGVEATIMCLIVLLVAIAITILTAPRSRRDS